MSLRTRLLAAIFLALLISFSLGAGLAAWRAARTTHDELAASRCPTRGKARSRRWPICRPAQARNRNCGASSARSTAAGICAPRCSTNMARCARREPAGNRTGAAHMVSAARGAVAETAVVAPVFGVPGIAALRLQAEPRSEAGERWWELRERVASFGIFFLLAAALCSVTAFAQPCCR